MRETTFATSAQPIAAEQGGLEPRGAGAAARRGLTFETRQLSRVVGGKRLVDDVSVAVPPGEVLAVVGPSGAGKSSFLRLLNRLDEPTSGSVLVDGADYRAIAPRDLRRRVGMVMQTAYLFPGSVADNIAFGPRQRGEELSPEEIGALLARVGLPAYAARDVTGLSGGEAQRVSIARTLANAPEALLADEPTSALDEASARGIEELILGIIRERAMTCVIVTHNKAQAERMAARAMLMESGRLIAVGPIREVLNAG
ncbi:MAG TPA: phosphate ABC transporter ATP-binding protein [Xanthobacteraceae bacterium]|nr:phosphate ABC transporter ATP-binding protein [Xanthobacteraceae bacterium]